MIWSVGCVHTSSYSCGYLEFLLHINFVFAFNWISLDAYSKTNKLCHFKTKMPSKIPIVGRPRRVGNLYLEGRNCVSHVTKYISILLLGWVFQGIVRSDYICLLHWNKKTLELFSKWVKLNAFIWMHSVVCRMRQNQSFPSQQNNLFYFQIQWNAITS